MADILCGYTADRDETSKHLVAQRGVEMLLPARIGDYTDFYAGIHHAMNVGSMSAVAFRSSISVGTVITSFPG